METILKLDNLVWYYMNVVWQNSFCDAVMPYIRNQYFWAPLYLFLLIFMTANWGWRGLMWCAMFFISFTFSDFISAHLMKPYFHRTRPCNDPYLFHIMNNIVPCGSGYSFPSSHAANHFSMGIFSAVTLSKYAKWVWPVALIWALLVSFAQVYVGVHYPLDVTVGALLGICIGILTGTVFNRKIMLERNKIA